MNSQTQISIQALRINTIDRFGHFSVSSTAQIGKHVANKRVEGFGEQGGDRGFFDSLELVVYDSDIIDSDAEKKG
jgi:hypothetical protein